MSHPNNALAEHTVPQATIWPAYAEPYGVAPAQYGPAHHYVAVPPPYAVAPPMYSAPAQSTVPDGAQALSLPRRSSRL